MTTTEFQAIVWQFAQTNSRSMPWRDNTDPYYILVSEIMLQQTQAQRVIPKFTAFIKVFSDVRSLANAPLAEVLNLWSGLGYNRRAKYLLLAARKIIEEFDDKIPATKAELTGLAGIGEATAGAILVYGFNQPAVFIETNIRTVYFKYFFNDQLPRDKISDKRLAEKVRQTLDQTNPRRWYWALMDYGAWLKQNSHSTLRMSAHYKKQPPLVGSLRETRGRIIKAMLQQNLTQTQLKQAVGMDERFNVALRALVKEGLIKKHGRRYGLA